MYPNPVRGGDYVYFAELQDVKVYSLQGQLLLQMENVNQLNISTLSFGVYLLKNEANEAALLMKE